MVHKDSVQALWEAYVKTLGEILESAEKTFDSWHFCHNREDADALGALVLQGVKKATAGALWSYEYEKEPLPSRGDYVVITNWDGQALCVVRMTQVEVVPFNEVSESFARAEGEGDGSLRYWRRVHREFFTRELRGFGRFFEETMPVVCQHFEVVYKPPL